MATREPTWDELWAEAKRVDMIELAHRLGTRLKRRGANWIGPCPLGCAREDGFIITPAKGLFYCRPSGERGDAVDLVMHVRGDARTDALAFVLDRRPDAPAASPARAATQTGAAATGATCVTTTADAMALWREGQDPRGTLVERYLASRGLALDDGVAGDALCWRPQDGSMLALFRNVLTGRPQAISRTFLDGDARKIERKFLGPVGGAAIMLDAFATVLSGLHAGEGIESCLSARKFGLRPVWALGSASAIAALPVLAGVEALTLLQENDAVSEQAVEACAARWHAAGRDVIVNVSRVGKDLNDALRREVKTDVMKD